MVDVIKSFYEKYPLPHPVDTLDPGIFNGTQAVESSPSWLYHLYWPAKKFNLDLDILVAGCGTSQAVVQAAGLPQARITAIDVSERSLEHSKKLVRQYNIHNIDHHLLKIEDVAQLNKKFDLIICIGVLHHLENPVAGLKALKSVLKPDGSIYLMLYAQYGRTGIYLLQEMFQRIGINPTTLTDEDVRKVGEMVRTLPKGHPLSVWDPQNFNINNYADIADLFINPRDKAYTVPGVYQLLEETGMALQQWMYRFLYSPYCAPLFSSRFVEQIKAMPQKEQYTIGELYRGSITKHHFICCAQERDKASYIMDLDADDWKNFIPIYNGTVIVKEKAEKDGRSQWLSLPHYDYYNAAIDLSTVEVAIIKAMDGQKTIKNILDSIAPSALPKEADGFVRNLLKSLYEHDLIWFHKAS